MENKRYRHQVASVVKEVDDGVSECYGEQTVPHFEAIVEYTNRNAADGEQQISVLFGEAVVVVKKAAITNYDWVSYRRGGKNCEKSIKRKSIRFFFLRVLAAIVDKSCLKMRDSQIRTEMSSLRAGSVTPTSFDSHATNIFLPKISDHTLRKRITSNFSL